MELATEFLTAMFPGANKVRNVYIGTSGLKRDTATQHINTCVQNTEDIINYLFKHYGDR